MRSLILGGARSGKSIYAERMATEGSLAVTYVATAGGGEDSMRERITMHRARRPASWACVEEPLALASTLQRIASNDSVILVDCLTLWLTNLLCAAEPSRLDEEKAALLHVLPSLPGEIIMVSNETGLGVIPMGELTRRYVDEAGLLHQALSAICERVIFVTAGLPLALKGGLA